MKIENKRILFLSNCLGGLKAFRFEFIDRLNKDKNTVGICSPFEYEPKIFEDLGCECFELQMSRHGLNPLKEIKVVNQIRKVIRNFKPDVILSYTIKPNIYGALAAHKEGVPIIATITGLGPAVTNGGPMGYLSVSLLKLGLKKANHVFFQNQANLDFFEVKKIPLLSKSIVSGSGVNLEKFALTEYPKDDDGIHFLFTGRIVTQKGIGEYLEAAKTIKDSFPNTHFHIIGRVEDETYSNIIDTYHKEGIIEYHRTQSDVRPFIKMAHCQVHPTFYPEGMSNVLLESAAMGRPAITTNRTGCKEIVDDGITGYFVNEQDSGDLIKKLERFINLHWEKRRDMGLAARHKVEKYFDRSKVIEKYMLEIRELT